jgi:hypothetical protein
MDTIVVVLPARPSLDGFEGGGPGLDVREGFGDRGRVRPCCDGSRVPSAYGGGGTSGPVGRGVPRGTEFGREAAEPTFVGAWTDTGCSVIRLE